MAKSLILTVNVDRASVSDIARDATDDRGGVKAVEKLISKIGSGAYSGSIGIQTSTAAAARASGTITLTYASVANNDTVTIAGITLTCVTGSPTGAQFKKEVDLATTTQNLVNLINNLATLNIYVSATRSAGVVTVTAHQSGIIGNLITLATSNGTGFALSASALANGTGGASAAPVTYSRGI